MLFVIFGLCGDFEANCNKKLLLNLSTGLHSLVVFESFKQLYAKKLPKNYPKKLQKSQKSKRHSFSPVLCLSEILFYFETADFSLDFSCLLYYLELLDAIILEMFLISNKHQQKTGKHFENFDFSRST